MSRTSLSFGPQPLGDLPDRVTISTTLPPEQYQDHTQRAVAKIQVHGELRLLLAIHQRQLLDSPVGRWTEQQETQADGTVATIWRYDLRLALLPID